MMRNVCPICDRVMKSAHYCKNCRKWIWRPYTQDINYYLNERRPARAQYGCRPESQAEGPVLQNLSGTGNASDTAGWEPCPLSGEGHEARPYFHDHLAIAVAAAFVIGIVLLKFGMDMSREQMNKVHRESSMSENREEKNPDEGWEYGDEKDYWEYGKGGERSYGDEWGYRGYGDGWDNGDGWDGWSYGEDWEYGDEWGYWGYGDGWDGGDDWDYRDYGEGWDGGDDWDYWGYGDEWDDWSYGDEWDYGDDWDYWEYEEEEEYEGFKEVKSF